MSASAPQVSVITPVFNRATVIADAVHSVLGQSHGDLEHLVVDDGSTDGTLAVVRALASEDERVRVVAADHGGPAAARNRALEVARGGLVTFLDSDDLMPPDRVERQLRYLAAHPDVDAVLGTQEFAFPAGSNHRRGPRLRWTVPGTTG